MWGGDILITPRRQCPGSVPAFIPAAGTTATALSLDSAQALVSEGTRYLLP